MDWQGKPKFFSFIVDYVFGVLCLAFGGYLIYLGGWGRIPHDSRTAYCVLGCIPLLFSILVFSRALVTYGMTQYRVGGEKVEVKSGFFIRKHVSCLLTDIRNVTVSQSLLGAVLGYGQVEITTAATTSNATIKFSGIRDFKLVAAMLQNPEK